MSRPINRTALLYVAGWLSVTLFTAAASANIELQLVPDPECAGRTLSVSLYAISDDPNASQSLAAMDVILTWDPQVLTLIGVDTQATYPYAWLVSGFEDDHGLDGLNNTFADGNALYTALAQLGIPAYALPGDGLLVTSFLFRKLQFGQSTSVTMPPSYGLYSHTVVYSGVIPGEAVTGTLVNATFVPSARGDTNCDGLINFADINPFVQALSDPAAWQAAHPGCPFSNNDLNCDGFVNFADINPFVAVLSSPP